MLADKTGMRRKEDMQITPKVKRIKITDEELNKRFSRMAETEEQKVERIRQQHFNTK